MQDVYSNCIINLSLALSAHPNDSCFAGYEYGAILPFEVETIDTFDANTPKRYMNTVFPRDYFREALYDQPWVSCLGSARTNARYASFDRRPW
jgi:hypothetical protein